MCYKGCSKENYEGECTISGRCIYESNDDYEYDEHDEVSIEEEE